MSDPTAPRSEQIFFADPAIDRLMGLTMALAAEVYALRARLLTLESRIVDDAPAEESPEEDAASFVHRLCEPLLGEQQARGPT